MAEALYRKYRPQTFGDVVGQDHIEDTLKNAIQQDKVSHAYLFCGPRGTGKTTTARLLAKALMCQQGEGNLTSNPDGTCEDCRLIAAGEHPDVYELDAASRTGVENVREEIIGRVQFAPTRGTYKVYIIDEVHMLSTAAFNALLKTLEEPPSHVVFVLATTDPQKVPETIHSRCQRFDFRRISTEGMVARLGAVCQQEGVEFEGEALELIAHRAEGGMRNALTSLEQLIAFGKGKVTLDVAERMLGGIDSSDMAEIMDAIGRCDAAACFCWVASYVETGADLAQFVKDMAAHVRNLYVMSLAGASVALEVGETERAQLVKELPLFGSDRLARMLGVLGDVAAELKTSTNPRLSFEIALTRMVRPDSELTLEALAERIEKLERTGVSVAAAPVVGQRSVAVSEHQSSVSHFEATPIPETTVVADSNSKATPIPETVVSTIPASKAAPVPEATVAAVSDFDAASIPEAVAASASDVVAAPTPVDSSQSSGQVLPDHLLETWQNPAALQRMWAAVMATLKKNKAAYGVLFLNTKAVIDASLKTLQIEFPAENVFAFKAVQKPEVQDAVATALQQATGVAVPFSYIQCGSVVAVPASIPVSPSRESMPELDAAGSVSAGEKPEETKFVAAEPMPWEDAPESEQVPVDSYDAPEPEYVPLDAYDAPVAEPASWEDASHVVNVPHEPAEFMKQPASAHPAITSEAMKTTPIPDTYTSASLNDPGHTVEEIKDAITSVFGDGVVFETVD